MADTLTILDEQLLSNDIGLNLRIFSIGPARFGSTRRIAGGVLYTAPEDGTTDQFTYTIQDRYGNLSSATVTVNILEPTIVIARDNVLSDPIDCGTALTLSHDDLLTNDTGETALRVTAVANAVNGNVTLGANTVTFQAEDCQTLVVNKLFQAARRSVRSTLDPNGNVWAESLTADKENVNALVPGHIAIMSVIRLGASEMEAGWTLIADSSQAKLYFRVIDQAYVDRHNEERYVRDDDRYPYPYLYDRADDAMQRPEIRVDTFALPPGVPANDAILMAQANTHVDAGTFYFDPAPLYEDYYRNIYIDAFGPSGEDGTDTNTPVMLMYTTYRSDEDNLNHRQAEYVGNRLTYAIQGDTLGVIHGGGGTQTFSENGHLSNISNLYCTAYALREVPRDPIIEAGFTYTAEDMNGSTDTARVILPVRPGVNPRVSRIRQSSIFLNEDGWVGFSNALNVGSYALGVHVKQRETIDFDFVPSYNDPLDPIPDENWTVLAKTGPNPHVAGTMVYRPVVNTGENSFKAFRFILGMPGAASMTGIEIVAEDGETWEDIFVDCFAENATIPNEEFPYVCPKHDIPAGCHSLTFVTARPWTSLFKVSGGDSFVYHYSRRDFTNHMSMIVHSTTEAPHIVMRPLNPDRIDTSVSTMTLILRNRK